jgi:thiol:disulfide interchange protein DsbD
MKASSQNLEAVAQVSKTRVSPVGQAAVWIGLLRRIGIILILIGTFCHAASARAQIFSMPSHVSASITAEPQTVKPGGTGEITVTLTISPGFHIQSHTPFDPNLVPTELTVAKSPEIHFGKVVYPKPISIPASKIITPVGKLSVYEGTVKLHVRFHVLKAATGGRQIVTFHLQTQACNSVSCFIPQEQKLSVTIHVSGTAAGSSAPAGGASGGTAPITAKGTPTAIPSSVGKASPPMTNKAAIAAALAYIARSPYAPADQEHLPIWVMIGFALLGGLILNVMPCVLPVIPIKVMAMVEQAHGSRRKAIGHAIAFTIGVVALFMIIAVVLGVQKAAGGQLFFYGEQFQNPFFVVALCVIVALAALSMLGVWTINLPQAVYNSQPTSQGYGGSLFTGLLATVLATPCSAPFLGVMIAWALGQSIPVILLFFALVGIGMAAPYLLLAMFPGAIARIPRAGRWSELIKQGLGLITIGVAIYLLGTLPDRHEILIGAFITLAFCIGAWIWGQWPQYNMPRAKIWTIRGVAVGLSLLTTWGVIWFFLAGTGNASSAVRFSTPPSPTADATAPAPHVAIGRWQNFSLGRLRAALKEGHPVVLDFTANWCVNCKFVKATVLDNPTTRKNFNRVRAVLLRADLTTQNPVAQSLLVKLGGRSIPFLAIFSPQAPFRPEVLRDLYSIGDVAHALRRASITPVHQG